MALQPVTQVVPQSVTLSALLTQNSRGSELTVRAQAAVSKLVTARSIFARVVGVASQLVVARALATGSAVGVVSATKAKLAAASGRAMLVCIALLGGRGSEEKK